MTGAHADALIVIFQIFAYDVRAVEFDASY